MTDEDDRQSQGWARVSRYDNVLGASETASYVDHLNRCTDPEVNGDGGGDGHLRQAELAAGIAKIRPLLGQRGVLVGLGGEPAFVELFASTSSLRRHLPGLLEPAPIDAALLPAEPTPGRRARRFVGKLTMARIGVELAPMPDPDTPWLRVWTTTRFADSAGTISWCTPPSSTVATR